MDLNLLYSQHQREIIRARTAISRLARTKHLARSGSRFRMVADDGQRLFLHLVRINRMSRAMNVTMAEADVREVCRKDNISISAIEVLPSGGTHLVCTTSDDADVARRKLAKHMISGTVKRFAFYRG